MPKTVALCPAHVLGCTNKIVAFTAPTLWINSPTFTTRTLAHGAFAKIQYVTFNFCLTYLYCIGFRSHTTIMFLTSTTFTLIYRWPGLKTFHNIARLPPTSRSRSTCNTHHRLQL
jgi:hypothetical protein